MQESVDPIVAKDNEISELKAEVEKQTQLVSEMKDRYLRALADGENTRNRARKELTDSKLFSIQSFAKVSELYMKFIFLMI